MSKLTFFICIYKFTSFFAQCYFLYLMSSFLKGNFFVGIDLGVFQKE